MSYLIDLILHLDKHLIELVNAYPVGIYGLLFGIVFIETGLVVWPFLPGDSLLFAAGTLGRTGILNMPLTAGLLLVAAVAGDAVNYAIGRAAGPRVFTASDTSSVLHRLLNREHLQRAHEFFERYGGKAVVLGRFVPIVRTFVPFVAGAGAMTYTTFALYNVIGAVLWVGGCMGAGWLFGSIPVVRNNFSLVTIGIVVVSVLPIAIEMLNNWRKSRPPQA